MARVSLHLAVVIVLLLSGCSLLAEDEPVREDEAVAALDSARERAESVESYRFTLSIHAETADGSEAMTGEGTGRVNVSAQRLASNLTVEDATQSAYVTDTTAYRKCSPSGFWGQKNVTAENWTETTPIGTQFALLSTGDLYWNGTETVDGRDVVHITGHPSTKAIRERKDEPGTTPVFGGRNVDSVTVDVWLDEETYRLRQTRTTTTVSSDGQTATATMTVSYRAYGDAVSITVPADVREHAFRNGCPGD